MSGRFGNVPHKYHFGGFLSRFRGATRLHQSTYPFCGSKVLFALVTTDPEKVQCVACRQRLDSLFRTWERETARTDNPPPHPPSVPLQNNP